jgi:hypothetical protein
MVPVKFQMICLRGTKVIDQKNYKMVFLGKLMCIPPLKGYGKNA